MPLLRGRGAPQRGRPPVSLGPCRALLDQPCPWNIPASWAHHYCALCGPLKSDCPLECVRACRVYTGCRRDVDQGRRQIGIDVWIDGKTVRASRAHVPDHLCRCSHSLTAATVRRPRRPILWAGRAAAVESPAPRGAGPIGPVPRGADPARFGRCAAATVPRTRRPRAHHARSDRCSRRLERRYNGSGRPARPQKRLLWAAPVAAVRVAFSERWRRRRRPPGRSRAGPRRGARIRHVLVRAAPGGPSGCGGVGSPGELRAGARSVGPGPGVVPGCTEAREGVGRVPPCRSCALICENARADTYWCEYVGVVV